MKISVFDKLENIVAKGESAGYRTGNPKIFLTQLCYFLAQNFPRERNCR